MPRRAISRETWRACGTASPEMSLPAGAAVAAAPRPILRCWPVAGARGVWPASRIGSAPAGNPWPISDPVFHRVTLPPRGASTGRDSPPTGADDPLRRGVGGWADPDLLDPTGAVPNGARCLCPTPIWSPCPRSGELLILLTRGCTQTDSRHAGPRGSGGRRAARSPRKCSRADWSRDGRLRSRQGRFGKTASRVSAGEGSLRGGLPGGRRQDSRSSDLAEGRPRGVFRVGDGDGDFVPSSTATARRKSSHRVGPRVGSLAWSPSGDELWFTAKPGRVLLTYPRRDALGPCSAS